MMNERRELMIERYLDGTMDPSERQEFVRRMASDTALRRHVGTEQMIRDAVRGDREALPAPTQASRARFLTMVAAVSKEIGPAPSGSQGGSGGGGSSPLRLVRGSRLARMAPWAGGGVAIVLAALFLGPRWFSSSDAPASRVPAPAAVTGTGASGSTAVAPQPSAAAPSTAPAAATSPAATAPAATATASPESPATGGGTAGEGIASGRSKASSAPHDIDNPSGRGRNEGTSASRRTAHRTGSRVTRDGQIGAKLHKRNPDISNH